MSEKVLLDNKVCVCRGGERGKDGRNLRGQNKKNQGEVRESGRTKRG